MFVRIKRTPNSPKTAVQIVESVRLGPKVSQKIVRHIGYALDEQEITQLKMLAEMIKIKLESGNQQLLFPPEDLARLQKRSAPTYPDNKYIVNVKELYEHSRVITGINDIYGALFDQLGYADIFENPTQQKKLVETFRHVVLARIANPKSKLASVSMLEENFGVTLNLQYVYRMMDHLDEKTIEKLNEITYQNTLSLFGEKIDIIFFDATTIYFESFNSDELRDMGFSKDLKFNQPQVLLCMMVTKKGMPIGYKVFPGNIYEGHTLIPMLNDLKKRYAIDKVIFVADSGIFNKENIEELEKSKFEYIVGARLKNLSDKLKEKILNRKHYQGNDEFRVACFEDNTGKKIVVSYKADRARKDAYERDKAVDRLKKKLENKKNPKEYLANYGYKKFLKVDGNSHIELDEKKIEESKLWDGLHGVITNAQNISDREILQQYSNLWHIEESFRITKHDLKVRPIFHWNSSRIKAHLAICFTAYVLVRHLEYRVRLQYKKISIEKIRQLLIEVQTSILYHLKNNLCFALPSHISQEAKKIYQIMKVSRSSTPSII